MSIVSGSQHFSVCVMSVSGNGIFRNVVLSFDLFDRGFDRAAHTYIDSVLSVCSTPCAILVCGCVELNSFQLVVVICVLLWEVYARLG